MTKQYSLGFTLIELMIVVAIIGILASIAYSSYDTKPAQRSLAMTELSALAERMEVHKLEQGSYENAGPGGTSNDGVPSIYAPDPSMQYTLTIAAADPTSYTLRATPTGSQVGDGIIELTSTGRKRWDENNDGDFTDNGETNWKKN